MEPSDTSILENIMKRFMSGKKKPKQLQDTRVSWSISQKSGKLPNKKIQNITHIN